MMAPSEPSIGSVNTISAPNALQDPLPLGRDVLGHAQPHAVAARGADHRVGDAGVARRGVEQDLVARQRARPLAVGNHPRRRPVLHRAARVLPLGLGVELDVAQARLEARQPDQRRISDQIDDGRDVRGSPGVTTGISDCSSPRLSQVTIPSSRLPGPRALARAGLAGAEPLVDRLAVGVADLDGPKIRASAARPRSCAVADGDHDQLVRDRGTSWPPPAPARR